MLPRCSAAALYGSLMTAAIGRPRTSRARPALLTGAVAAVHAAASSRAVLRTRGHRIRAIRVVLASDEAVVSRLHLGNKFLATQNRLRESKEDQHPHARILIDFGSTERILS